MPCHLISSTYIMVVCMVTGRIFRVKLSLKMYVVPVPDQDFP